MSLPRLLSILTSLPQRSEEIIHLAVFNLGELLWYLMSPVGHPLPSFSIFIYFLFKNYYLPGRRWQGANHWSLWEKRVTCVSAVFCKGTHQTISVLRDRSPTPLLTPQGVERWAYSGQGLAPGCLCWCQDKDLGPPASRARLRPVFLIAAAISYGFYFVS